MPRGTLRPEGWRSLCAERIERQVAPAMKSFCGESQLLDSLKPETVKAFIAAQVESFYPQGTVLLDSAHAPDGIFVVLSGRVRLSAPPNGSAHNTRLARRGEVLGLSTVVCGRESETIAQTVSRARLAYLPKTYLIRLMERDPDFAYRVVCLLCSSLRDPFDHLRPRRRNHRNHRNLGKRRTG